jgi:hypothetical protein
MEWNSGFFLSDEEIKVLAIYLAYGTGLGVFIGMFFDNIQLFFSLGGVLSIIISLIKVLLTRNKINDN